MIYDGDSFQIELELQESLDFVVEMRSNIKQINGLDVRMAVGVGEKDYQGQTILESNGSAFINSGECFNELKRSLLKIKSNDVRLDTAVNTIQDLLMIIISDWTISSARVVTAIIDHPDYTQIEIADHLQMKQSNVSAALNKSNYEAIKAFQKLFPDLILLYLG